MAISLNGFTDHTIHTGEVEIGYSVGPDNGPTLLLAHGVTSRRDGFMRVTDSLIEKYRVVTIDQRGHGFSGHTPGKYAREDHARDIRFIIENVCDAQTVLWGHSMGGGNAIALAMDPPDQLKALVLEDAAIFGRKRPTSASGSPVLRQFQLFIELIDAGIGWMRLLPAYVRRIPTGQTTSRTGRQNRSSRWTPIFCERLPQEIFRPRTTLRECWPGFSARCSSSRRTHWRAGFCRTISWPKLFQRTADGRSSRLKVLATTSTASIRRNCCRWLCRG
ncbi:MAG: alpha/beta hydrolase [Chloroflexi bacterium]|nr:alpha/beta hydrolase [Chloroflexota bacterium]